MNWVKHLYDPYYDPLWEVCQDLGIVVASHGGTGNPDYGSLPGQPAALHHRDRLLLAAPVRAHDPRRRVRALPEAEVHAHRDGLRVDPADVAQLDQVINSIRATKSIGELRYTDEHVLPEDGHRVRRSRTSGWARASPARPTPRRAPRSGRDRFMWGSDYPHDEGTYPFTTEHLRQVFSDTPPEELQQILAGNAAELYDFDLDALAPEAERVGPTVEEIAEPLTELPDNANQALRRACCSLTVMPRSARAGGAGEDVVEPRACALVPRVGDTARVRAEAVRHVGRDEQLDFVAGRRPSRREHQRVVEQVVGACRRSSARAGGSSRSANAGEISGARRSSSVRPGR